MTYSDCVVFLRVATNLVETRGTPLVRTYIHVLKAHLHGRIHMHTYNGLHGGWKSTFGRYREQKFPTRLSLSKWLRCYASSAHSVNLRYKFSYINNLQDQADWLVYAQKRLGLFADVTKFVLENSRGYQPVDDPADSCACFDLNVKEYNEKKDYKCLYEILDKIWNDIRSAQVRREEVRKRFNLDQPTGEEKK